MKHGNNFILKGKKNCNYSENCRKHNNAQTNIVRLKPSGIVVASILAASLSPIIDIIEERNDHNVLDLAS
jgi:hypothetical protein